MSMLMHRAGEGGDHVSPELVLVDPLLSEVARRQLPDRPRDVRSADRGIADGVAATPSGPAGRLMAAGWTPDEFTLESRKSSWRLLAGVATTTVIVLLLLDVSVQVGERRAAAERQGAARSSGETNEGQPSTNPPLVVAPTPAPRGGAKPIDRRFAWAPTPKASGYRVEFYRGSARVYVAETPRAALTVPARWTYRGERRWFRAGQYQWYVWPIVSGQRASRATVQTTVSIDAS